MIVGLPNAQAEQEGKNHSRTHSHDAHCWWDDALPYVVGRAEAPAIMPMKFGRVQHLLRQYAEQNKAGSDKKHDVRWCSVPIIIFSDTSFFAHCNDPSNHQIIHDGNSQPKVELKEEYLRS